MSGDTEGVVLRIERTSIHDGPGLRTVLFLKGCSLSCTWCSTPESQNSFLEKGYSAKQCTRCATCVSNCHFGAITITDGMIKTDTSLCTNCFHCVEICPHTAQKGYGTRMSVDEAVEEISKDEIFFFHSGGGVTVSGGECFTQPEFTAAILAKCCERGIDTAIETSLFVPWRNIEKSLPYVNTMFVDLKHHDSKQHASLVGSGNEQILSNLKRLDEAEQSFKLHIRIPLIPGINDDDENISALIKIGTSLKKLREIEILPYHRLGSATYALLSRSYQLENLPSPSTKYLAKRLAILKKQNLSVPVKIGSGYL